MTLARDSVAVRNWFCWKVEGTTAMAIYQVGDPDHWEAESSPYIAVALAILREDVTIRAKTVLVGFPNVKLSSPI